MRDYVYYLALKLSGHSGQGVGEKVMSNGPLCGTMSTTWHSSQLVRVLVKREGLTDPCAELCLPYLVLK